MKYFAFVITFFFTISVIPEYQSQRPDITTQLFFKSQFEEWNNV